MLDSLQQWAILQTGYLQLSTPEPTLCTRNRYRWQELGETYIPLAPSVSFCSTSFCKSSFKYLNLPRWSWSAMKLFMSEFTLDIWNWIFTILIPGIASYSALMLCSQGAVRRMLSFEGLYVANSVITLIVGSLLLSSSASRTIYTNWNFAAGVLRTLRSKSVLMDKCFADFRTSVGMSLESSCRQHVLFWLLLFVSERKKEVCDTNLTTVEGVRVK